MADKLVTLQDENQQPIYPETRASVVKTSSGKTVEEALGEAGISDAPKDGKTYGRNNGSWVETIQMEEAPTDGFAYARKNGTWAEVIESTETATLNNYSQAETYSSILPTDSINAAIGKLEAGIESGGFSSDNAYYISSKVLDLKATSTSEEINSALGGDIRSEIINAINSGKKIYIEKGSSNSYIPVFTYHFLTIMLYIGFIKQDVSGQQYYVIGLRSSAESTIKVVHINGVLIDSNINNLNTESASSDISSVFGSLEDIKDLCKKINDGNIFYTKQNITGMTNSYSYMPLGITISNDSSKYYIIVSGIIGEGFTSFFNTGHLYISYDIASNTYTCQKFSTSIS